MGVRWVSVSVRGMLRGCGAVNRAHHRAGLLRRAGSGGVQSERARKHVSMYIYGFYFSTKIRPYRGGLGRFGAAPMEAMP